MGADRSRAGGLLGSDASVKALAILSFLAAVLAICGTVAFCVWWTGTNPAVQNIGTAEPLTTALARKGHTGVFGLDAPLGWDVVRVGDNVNVTYRAGTGVSSAETPVYASFNAGAGYATLYIDEVNGLSKAGSGSHMSEMTLNYYFATYNQTGGYAWVQIALPQYVLPDYSVQAWWNNIIVCNAGMSNYGPFTTFAYFDTVNDPGNPDVKGIAMIQMNFNPALNETLSAVVFCRARVVYPLLTFPVVPA